MLNGEAMGRIILLVVAILIIRFDSVAGAMAVMAKAFYHHGRCEDKLVLYLNQSASVS